MAKRQTKDVYVDSPEGFTKDASVNTTEDLLYMPMLTNSMLSRSTQTDDYSSFEEDDDDMSVEQLSLKSEFHANMEEDQSHLSKLGADVLLVPIMKVDGEVDEEVHVEVQTFSMDDGDSDHGSEEIQLSSAAPERSESPRQCSECGLMCANGDEMLIHMRTHPDAFYKCRECGRSFAGRGSLNKHMRTHTGETPFICPMCGRGFAESGNLAKHIRTHTGETPFACPICNRCFSESGSLNRHLKTHSGETPHDCAECGRRFSERSSLKRHMRTHCGETPYVCAVCLRSFSHGDNLTRHLKTHPRHPEPYRCGDCEACFSDCVSLTKHMKIHIPEAPYNCLMCGKACNTKSSLIAHIKNHRSDDSN